MQPSKERVRVAAVLALYFILGAVLAMTRPPHGDEGQFVSGAAQIAENGRFAMPMWREWAPGIEKHVYVTTPLYFVLGAGWFKIFGIGLITLRMFSVTCGLLLLLAWYQFLRVATRDALAPFLGLVILGLHYDFINLTNTRYDPVCATFSACAIASYVTLRERSFRKALLVANAFQAAALITHPFGTFGAVGLLIFILMLDWKQVRGSLFSSVALSAAPYVVALGGWGLYIAQDVENFKAQIQNNASGRLGMWKQPIGALFSEIHDRYIVLFAGWRPGAPAMMRVKILLLPVYLIGYIGCWLTPSIRENKLARALLVYTLAAFLLLTYIDGNRLYIYMVHALPLYLVCLTLWTRSLMDRGALWRSTAWAGIAGLTLFTFATIGYRAKINSHANLYLPSLEYLQKNIRDNDLVMATGEFGVGLQFEKHVLDDYALGFRNGMTPDYFVVDETWQDRLDGYKVSDPALYTHLEKMLSTYEKVHESELGGRFYQVYRKPAG